MFSQYFNRTGWLNRYFLYRLKSPFKIDNSYLEFENNKLQTSDFDNSLYRLTRKNGIFFGCPVISPSLTNLSKKLNFPEKKGGAVLLFLETLFSVSLIENELFLRNYDNGSSKNYEIKFLKIILLFLRYNLPRSYYRININISLDELLKKNETMKRALKKLELVLLESITIKGYSSLGNRQNIFAFLRIYFFLLWVRKNSGEVGYGPGNFIKMDSKIREEMILFFTALICADNFLNETEKHIIEKYIEQSGLSSFKKIELSQRILVPLKLEKIKTTKKSLILSNYIVEQLILLSLINNQNSWQERELIENISKKLGLAKKDIDQLFYSVADFFSTHYKRLEFLKNNTIIQQFQDYTKDRILSIVKKNLSSILNEIKETKELYNLIVKSSKQQLNNEEKRMVQEQLLDIARSIPALAIFALPGGGLLLAIIIKVLPFNILPSSFLEDPNTSQNLD